MVSPAGEDIGEAHPTTAGDPLLAPEPLQDSGAIDDAAGAGNPTHGDAMDDTSNYNKYGDTPSVHSPKQIVQLSNESKLSEPLGSDEANLPPVPAVDGNMGAGETNLHDIADDESNKNDASQSNNEIVLPLETSGGPEPESSDNGDVHAAAAVDGTTGTTDTNIDTKGNGFFAYFCALPEEMQLTSDVSCSIPILD